MGFRKKEAYVRICPKCKSTDVSDDMSNPTIKFIGQIENMVCNNCGYAASFFPEAPPSEIAGLKKDQKKNSEKENNK